MNIRPKLALRGLAAVSAALIVGTVVATSIVIAQEGADPERPPDSLAEDPTAIPVATNPGPVPRPHDQIEPLPTRDGPVTQQKKLPAAADIFTTEDGKYQSVETDGCVWTEERRAVLPRRDKESVVLRSPCEDHIALIYDPDSKNVEILVGERLP